MSDSDICYEKKKKLNGVEGIENKRSHILTKKDPWLHSRSCI